jgi:hypothetical protein
MVKGVVIVAAAVVACGCGAAGDVVAPEITVASETIVPVLVSPAEGGVLDNGCSDHSEPMAWSFDWSDVPRAERYHVYAIGRTATYPAVDREVVTSSYSESTTAYVANQYRFGWRWKVRAFVDGSWREFSPERSFDVEPLNTDCPR